jgi:hypothetical protein
MAATVVFDGINVTEAEAADLANWSNSVISAVESWTEIKIQGSASVGYQANNKDGYGWYDYSGTGSFDFDTSGAEEGQHVFIWLNFTTPGILDLIANHGIYLMLGDSDTTFNCYVIGGSDALDKYNGGWTRFVLDPRKTPSFTIGGGAAINAINRFGVGVETVGSSRADNLFIDRIDVGWGLRIYGTSVDGWADVIEADMNTLANVYGILQEKDGIYFAHGRLEVGDNVGTGATAFEDTDRIIRWVSQQYYLSGEWVDMIGDDFFQMSIVSNSSAITAFSDGIIVGSGDTARGRNGSTFLGSDLHITTVDLDDGNNADNTLTLYGTTFRYMDGGISGGGDTDHKMYGCVIDQCSIFDPGGGVVIRNTTFSGTRDENFGGSALKWATNMNIKNSNFIANTAAVDDPHAILHVASGLYQYDNLQFAGNEYDIMFSGALSSDFLTIESLNTANPSTYEVIVGSGVDIQNAVFLNVDVKDDVGAVISGVAVAIYTASGIPTQLMNEYTNVLGRAQESYNYLGDMPISIKLRKSSPSSSRYFPVNTTGTIGATGFGVTVTMIGDNIAT